MTGAAGAPLPQLNSANILAELDTDQAIICASTTGKTVLVNAGAGSGKTRLVIRQIAFMMAEKLVLPSELMVITFTNKAANELKQRLAALVGEDLAKQVELIGTFHSVFIKLLRRFLKADLGWGSFTLMDEDDRARMIKAAMIALKISPQDSDIGTAVKVIGLWKSNLILPDQAMADAVKANDPVKVQIAEIYEAYMGMSKNRQMMDFDDILLYTVLCLRENGVMKRFLHSQIKRIYVDEFQDTNPVQSAFCELAIGPDCSMMAIGDDRQGIYSFRGADIRNILHFKKAFPDAEIRTLPTNYRSQAVIVEAAEAVIQKNTEQLEKTCVAHNPRGELIRVLAAESEDAEAEAIVYQIQSLRKSRQYEYNKMAVLFRASWPMRRLEAKLLAARIPYVIEGGVQFYGRMEIRDVLAMLRAAINPRDDAAVSRLFAMRDGVGEASMDAYTGHAAANGVALVDSLFTLQVRNGRAREQAAFMVDWLSRMQMAVFAMALPDFLELASESFGYDAILQRDCKKSTDELTGRRQNVAELIRAASEYQQAEPGIMAAVKLLDMAIQSENRSEAVGVRIMTVHASKGLEFPVVFVASFSDDVFPNPRANLSEERRLAYVAMTRAEQLLFLSYPGCRYSRSGGERAVELSPFVKDIPPEFLQYE